MNPFNIQSDTAPQTASKPVSVLDRIAPALRSILGLDKPKISLPKTNNFNITKSLDAGTDFLTKAGSKVATHLKNRATELYKDPVGTLKRDYNEFNTELSSAIKTINDPNATREQKNAAIDVISAPVIGSTGNLPGSFGRKALTNAEINARKAVVEGDPAATLKAIEAKLGVKPVVQKTNVFNVGDDVVAQTKTVVPEKAPTISPEGRTLSSADARRAAVKESVSRGEYPSAQISDEGIPLAPNARQRAIMEGKISPGEKLPPELGGRKPAMRPRTNELPFESQVDELRRTKIGSTTPLQTAERQFQGSSRVPNGPSLPQIVDNYVPSVKRKVGILDYLRTPEIVLKKIGLGKEAALLRKQYDAYLKELPENIKKINAWSKEVPKESNQKIFQFLDGQDVTLNDAEMKVAREIQAWFREWAERLKLPEDKRISSYITHIFEPDFIQKEFDPDLAKLIRDKVPGSVYDPFLQERLGALGYIEDTWRALDAYVKRATRKVHMDPALERLQDAAQYLDIDTFNYIKRYAQGINLRPNEIDNLIDNTIKQIVGYKYGQRPLNTITRKARQMVYRGTLGLNVGSALRNLTQGVNTYAELGERFAMKGYIDLLRYGTKELKDVGVLLDDLAHQDRAMSATKGFLQKLDKGLFSLFELVEKINRGSAYYGAKAKALAKGKSIDEAVEYAKKVVRKTQFTFGSVDTPVALQSDIMKTLSQLQSFSVKQIEFLGGKVKERDIAGLMRYIGGSMVMMHTIGKLFGMRWLDLIPSLRFQAPPTLGVPKEIAASVDGEDKYGNPLSAADITKNIGSAAIPYIPAGAQLKKTIEGLKAVGEGKDTTKSGRTKYKIDQTSGNYLRAALFGKYNLPQAREYFEKQKGGAKSGEKSNPFNI